MPMNTRFGARHEAAGSRGIHDAPQRLPTVVIGAGPYGLATAAWLSAAGTPRRVFGEPMECWHANMPEGMFLKSVPAASSSPRRSPDTVWRTSVPRGDAAPSATGTPSPSRR